MANDQANEGAEQNTTQPGQQSEADKGAENQQVERQRPRIKIGSQRQASGVFRAKPQNVAGPLPQPEAPVTPAPQPVAAPAPTAAAATPLASPPPAKVEASTSAVSESTADVEESSVAKSPAKSFPARGAVAEVATPRPAPPDLRETISENLDDELEAAMGGMALDAMMAAPTAATAATDLEPDSQHRGRVLFVRGSHVFVELGGRNQGLVPITQFEVLPKAGDVLEVSVRRFDPAEGLYELSVPDAAVSVGGWDQLSEGMVVDAAVTGHNAGGLEVEVNKLRGFIPISQVSLYRVENLAEFVGQRFTCVVTEVNPEARNLVLSRRAMLERERAEAKTKLLEEIDVGQDREGVVTRIQPFGAFVDIGGVDGLVHVSQMSWERVADPNQVLSVGQRIKVRVVKFDRDTGKIGLSYRESWDNPWDKADRKYTPKTKVSGTVSKLTEFGAFVKLEAGIEGLIHISELSHRRVFRASDVVKEGQEVEVLVLSLDKEQQRISLSLKALESRPEPKKKEDEIEEPVEAPVTKRKNQGPLKGGIGGASGGEKFGLKW